MLAMQGVGPATASAMLTTVSPTLPFMSDEALAAALPGQPEYTIKKYLQLVQALRSKADALSKSSGKLAPQCAWGMLPCVVSHAIWPVCALPWARAPSM